MYEQYIHHKIPLSFCRIIMLFSIILPTLFFPAVNIPADTGPLQSDDTIAGIDVSKWQGEIDFNQVAASGVEIVYIRACYGSSTVDEYFESNYAKARAAGLKIGFYHYITATNETSAIAQARFFYSLISDKKYDCRPAMDFEFFGFLSKNRINDIARTYLSTLQNLTGTPPLLYSDINDVNTIWDASLSVYPLWAADYNAGSNTDTGFWQKWSGFQYSSSGTVPGISGNVDLDRFRETVFLTSDIPFPDKNPNIYIIQRGDTLSGIAFRYHTTVEQLAALNHLSNPNLIYPGTRLILPTTSSAPPIQYVVRPGDTLYGIALKFNTTIAALAAKNNILNPNLIFIGQILII